MNIPNSSIIRTLRFLSLCLVFAACSHQAPTAPQPAVNSISGVIENNQGYTVPDATIQAFDASNTVLDAETTDSTGAFTLHKLPDDLSKVNLRVTHPDYTQTSIDLQSLDAQTGGGTAEPGIAITVQSDDSCCGTLDLTVLHSGLGLRNAQVLIRRNDHLVESAYTDSTGYLTFHHLCSGNFNIRISKDGYQVSERNFTIQHCDSATIVDTMATSSNGQDHADSCCNGLLTIVAEDSATGHGVSGATVTVTRSGLTRTETTADNGHAGIHELCAGTYIVHIADTHYRSIDFSVTLTCNDTLIVTRLLSLITSGGADSCCAGSITLTVRDSATNALLDGGSASLWHGGSLVATKSMSTSGVTFDHLCTGEYSFSLSKDGYTPVEFTVQLICNQASSVSHILTHVTAGHDTCCNGVAEVTVRDSATQSVIAGASVALYKSGTLLRTLTSGSDGSVRFGDLCTGGYSITISRDGYHATTFDFGEDCNTTHGFVKSLLAASQDGCDTASLTIRLQDSTHQDTYITGAAVTIRIDGHSDTIANGTTTDGGYFYTHNNLPGHATYILTFTKDGYNTKTVVWQITDCHNYHETFLLSHH